MSRNGHVFASFRELASEIGDLLPQRAAVLDGEIVCLDKRGHPKFHDLLFHRARPCFIVFDLLFVDSKDLRYDTLVDRKLALRRLLFATSANAPAMYADHVEGSGEALFERACKRDLEGIVAKYKYGSYVADREQSTWLKIRNPTYSQMAGRSEVFDRERHREPVPGWHACELACAELAAASWRTIRRTLSAE